MSLSDLFKPLVKWWWLIVIVTLVAGVSSYVVTRPQPPVYVAQTTLMVGRALSSPNPNSSQLGLGVDLATTYTQLAQRDPIKNATMAALGLPKLPTYTVEAIPNTQLIQIQVTDINPARAAAVANELAAQLIKQSPTDSGQLDPARQAFVNQQLDQMQTEIQTTQQEIGSRQQSLQGMTSAVQITDAQNAINALQSKLALLQTNYTTLLDNSQQGAANTLSVIEAATPPRIPVGPNKPLIILLVSMVGLLLAAATAHLLEFLDRTLKTPEDVQQALDLPVVGFISDMGKKNDWSYVANHPRSPIAEAFRALRNNVDFTAVDRPIQNILITSPGSSDGKSTVATNLAIIIGQAEKKVVLVDADLRRPSIHQALNMPIQPGLTDVFRDKTSIFDVIRTWKERHISIITSGNPPPNPAEMLGSNKMDQILNKLDDVADVVILDGPPALVTDSSVLAKKADAVLLVIRPGQTRDNVARAMVDQMRRAGANVVGVVLNRIPRRAVRSYTGYQAYSPYYSSKDYFSDGGEPPKDIDEAKPILAE